MVNTTQRKPTKKEVRTLVEALDDLLLYSRAHLNQTDADPGFRELHTCGRRLHTWGDLNAAIHRAEQVLEARNNAKT